MEPIIAFVTTAVQNKVKQIINTIFKLTFERKRRSVEGYHAQDHDALKITMKELRENNKCKSTAAISCTNLFKGKTISCTSMRPSNGCHAVTLSVIF